jgi:beta-barrel assembly-enhancing protease
VIFRKALMLAAIVAGLASAQAADVAQVSGPGYAPTEKDERGLWMQAEEYERNLKHSTFVMREADINTYIRDVFCKTVGQAECKDVRIYVMRTPYFNASMAPNGMMVVYSGLFLRARNEAQLAAVLGHEYTHYRNRHSIIGFRDLKKKLGAAVWLSMIDGGMLTATALIGGYFANSREMEAEADAGSIPMMVKAGYDPHSAGLVWEQLRAEMDATALARNKKSRKDKDRGMFQSHPPSAERMTTLKKLADEAKVSTAMDDRRDAYRKALAPYWASFVDDQIKLNDFGGTDFLLGFLAKEGWTADLQYARGELYRARGTPADLTQAAGFYRQAIALGDAPAEAWRGLGLSLLRSGAVDEGKLALKDYLKKRPDASDKAMMVMLAGG